ncbi:multidrug DMT transporter permease [Sphingobium sp. TA15]|nr:DMT family transporter [Sphingobium indicum]BDD68660.1 multidrug DMT transporter permease [Sphingobium sp. TA15]
MSSQMRAYAMLGMTMALWAGNAIVGRAMRGEIPPLTLAFSRWMLALLIIAPFAWRRVMAQRALIRRHWGAILFLGLAGVAAFNGFLYSGLRHTTAANGLLLQGLIPTFVVIISRIAFGDRAPLRQVAGIALSTLGVTFIVFKGELAEILRLRLGMGDLLVLCGCGAWAVYTACLRLRPAIDPLAFLFVTFAIGALTMGIGALGEAQAIARMHWSGSVASAIAYVAIFPSIIAYMSFNAAVSHAGAGAAGQTISLLPLFGAVLAALILGEPLFGYHLAGMALILGGVLLSWGARAQAGDQRLSASATASAPAGKRS